MKKALLLILCLFAVASALQWKVLGNANAWYVYSNTFRAESWNQVWLGNGFLETLALYDVGGQDSWYLRGTVGYQIKWGFSPVIQYDLASWGTDNLRVGLRWCYYFGGEL